MESGHKSQKIITICILTCNRKKILFELLDSLAYQTIIDEAEVIVVDNASTDGTTLELPGRYPWVKCLALDKNTGCGGRNAGIRNASAKYVVTLDDDISLHYKDTLERIVEYFNGHPDVHAINFKVLFYDSKELIPFNWFHPRNYKLYSESTFKTDYISEGAVAFRKEIFEKAGYYPEEFFLGHEGYDLAYRIIDNGCNIIYNHTIEVLHKCSHQQRTTWRNTYFDTRNQFWLLIRHFPIPVLIKLTIFKLATTFAFAVSDRQIKWYFRALYDSLLELPVQLRKRKVLSRKAIKELKDLRRLSPGLIDRTMLFLQKSSIRNRELK